MSSLVTSPMAVYQLTRLQQEIVKPLKLQEDLHDGYTASIQQHDDYQQTQWYITYASWCEANQFQVGTQPPPLTTMKVQAIIASFYFISLIKHPLGCIESVARIPFSALTFIAEAIVDAPLINRAFSIETSSKLKEFNRHLGNPFSNMVHAIEELYLSFVYGFGAISHRLSSDFSRVYEHGTGALERGCQHELREMTGDSTWQIYAAVNRPNSPQSY